MLPSRRDFNFYKIAVFDLDAETHRTSSEKYLDFESLIYGYGRILESLGGSQPSSGTVKIDDLWRVMGGFWRAWEGAKLGAIKIDCLVNIFWSEFI